MILNKEIKKMKINRVLFLFGIGYKSLRYLFFDIFLPFIAKFILNRKIKKIAKIDKRFFNI